jgi:putative addiction module component (TIGR02574 family)
MMIQAAEIEQMSLEERLQTMELLWASLARTPEAVPSPDWHREIIATRLAKIERGEGEFLTIAELKERLHKPTP